MLLGSMFINNCNITLHVSGAFSVHPQEHGVAANKLNKQSRTADEGWSSSLGVGRGANNSSL